MDIEIVNKIRALANEGMYLAQIAKMLGIRETTIAYQCKINNIKIQSSGVCKIHGALEDQIRLLILDGNTIPEIYRKTGVKQPTLFHWAKRHGLKIKSGDGIRITKEQGELIAQMAKEGKSKTAIAKSLGLTRPPVATFCKMNNIIIQKGTSRKFTHEQLREKLNPALEMTGKENKGKYEVKCKKHDFAKFRPATDFHQGCPICSNNGDSKGQQEVRAFIESLGFEVFNKKHIVVGDRRELDLVIESKKIAIEYCGLHWHCELHKSEDNHASKLLMANQNGYRLITIFADEWQKRNFQVKNYLKSVFGITLRKLYARECTIKTVSCQEAADFLNKYHIQGGGQFKIALGLYHSDELVGVVTGNRHHRNQSADSFVLNRLVFKDDISVTGGASKLLQELISYAKQQGYKKLISWSDNRWSEGNVYSRVGFTLEENLRPDYSYIKHNKRFSKQSCQKKHLLKQGATGNTETEMANSLGLYKIWDCGKKRWAIDL